MKRILYLFFIVLCCSSAAHSQQPSPKPLRLAVAGMSHGHVPWILNRPARGDIQLAGIWEPNRKLAERYAKQYGLREDLFFTDLDQMLDAAKPAAVTAFGTTFDHLKVVRACAPRGIHVMVEKPLAVNLKHALEIEALAKKHAIHVLTNYETTWYSSTQALDDLVIKQQVIGPLRKIVVHDGHPGPKEIGVNVEFLEWLIDPVRNGGGALPDFGCYGANLVTWLMRGETPLTVTAITQQIKPEIYSAVEDEATIILTYPKAQAILQASWNWPFNRKDIEVYGRTGYVHAPDGRSLRVRKENETQEQTLALERRSAPTDDPFAYLAAVVRGEVKVADSDLSALGNNVTVMRILEAARQSAATGKTVKLAPH
ncbi:MAG: Gfo/Idh/MocA family protein [Blastocatellia bacterium]